MTIVLSVVVLVALLVIVLSLLSMPDHDDQEEVAGLVTGNWRRLHDWWKGGDQL